ncbi:DUF4178 domain-containing protein [Longispora sp. K20-0274]|uniref:DUF4178 domain-containing protein n=1 Tax=Longispora sp. K20-0274 TaxID=3088255 RepID=UPI00399B38E0
MNSLVIAVLLAVVAVLLIVVVVVVLAARRAARRHQASDAATLARAAAVDPLADLGADAALGDPRRLGPGDTVEIRGHAYVVRGSLHITEGSWSWKEHLLGDAETSDLWLSVEEDPDLIVVLWTDVRGATVTPGPATVELDGRRYASDESGTARYTAVGTTGLDPAGTLAYHDYKAGSARLSFERYGSAGKWEVARGEQLHRHELRVFPRS